MKSILLVLMLIAPLSAPAQAPAPANAIQPIASTSTTSAQPLGQIETTAAVSDPVFGVHVNVLGLERRVEMLQWRKGESVSIKAAVPPHYEQAWTTARIDASGFDAVHRNTGDLPFNGERWWARDPKLDGRPVSADVLAALDAWMPLKPDLSQLPTNLAVSFQPDGDWLSTSQDPAHPQIGDVRVRWYAIEHASAPGGTTLIAGRWELSAPTAHATAPAVAQSQLAWIASGSDAHAWVQRLFGYPFAWLIAAGLSLALLLLNWKRRR